MRASVRGGATARGGFERKVTARGAVAIEEGDLDGRGLPPIRAEVAGRSHPGWLVASGLALLGAVLLMVTAAGGGAASDETGVGAGEVEDGRQPSGAAAPTDEQHDTDGSAAAGEAPDPDGESAEPALPPLLGSVDGLELRSPTATPVVVGFHEASRAAFAIEPVGRLVSNENTTRFVPGPDRADGVGYHVLSSRGRPPAPTSAVDVVMTDQDPVLAPVTGVISDLRSYYLYGRHLDHRVEIVPDELAGVRVVLVHLEEPVVAEGDRVFAGRSVLAGGAQRFPFSSQIDRETEPERWPHVHIEVQPIGAPRPGDEAP